MADDLTSFYSEIRQILERARSQVRTAVNSAMVDAYWQIGKRIVEEEQGGAAKAQYGQRLLENLSTQLAQDFGKGFSYSNLRNCRQFYLTTPENSKCYALRSKLSWTHHRLIMRVSDPQARLYYLEEAQSQNWSSRVLERQIKTHTYQRLISTQEGHAPLSSVPPGMDER